MISAGASRIQYPGHYQAGGLNGGDTNSNLPGDSHELGRQQPGQSIDNWLLPNEPDIRYHDLVPTLEQNDNTSLPSWDVFGDSTFWDMEAGLGEYAYGDPMLLFSKMTGRAKTLLLQLGVPGMFDAGLRTRDLA